MTGIYIHIPFCKKKCNYCDFNSYSKKKSLVKNYVASLKDEIARRANQLDKTTGTTIFFGGGTPSLLAISDLEAIMLHIKKSVKLSNTKEVAIEVNPGSVNKKYLNSLLETGFNRISIGVQSFCSIHLKSLGRIHSAKEAVNAVKAAKEVGFENISIDLIYGITNETLDDFNRDIATALELSPDHISLYNLTPEKGTPLAREIEEGVTVLPDEEEQIKMFKAGIKTLTEAEFKHYEISNFSKPFKECRHNIIYWENQSYAGFGAGAWSYLNGYRWQNSCEVESYIESVKSNKELINFKESLSEKRRMNETIIMNLRMIQGIEKKKFMKRFGVDIMDLKGSEIHNLEKQGLIINQKKRLKLTKKGILFSDSVFMEFV